MHKGDFTKAVAAKAGITQEQAKATVDAAFEIIAETVAAGEKVTLTGFGTFERKQRPARNARNPHSGGTVHVPATFVPKFKVGAEFRGAVRGKAA